jgi:predicted DNA-binding transcriptional regulator AlpA
MRLLTQDDLADMNAGPKSRIQRWRWIRAGKFPEPRQMGNRYVWVESEIVAWMESQIAAKAPARFAGPRVRSPGRRPRKVA